jgi:hypothetical protein
MSKNKLSAYEWLGAAAIVAVCVLVFAALWLSDPAQRTVSRTAPAAPLAIRVDTMLTTLPGLETRPQLAGAAIVCRPKAGERAAIRRGERLPNGALYFDVKVSPTCYGWVHVGQLVGVAPETIERY